MKYSNSFLCILCVLFMFVSVNSAISATKSDLSVDNQEIVSKENKIDRIDINNADDNQLTQLPGVGPKMATRITDYRKINGPFKSVDDLLNVKGIGPKVLQKIKPLVKIS